jgi:hypothetical protein
LGGLEPIGRFIYTSGSFYEKTKVAQYLGYFSRGKSYVLILSENGLGYILGDFLHKPI